MYAGYTSGVWPLISKTMEDERHGTDLVARGTTAQDDADRHRERRLGLLIRRLPARLQSIVHRLRRPQAKWLRIPAGIAFIFGGLFAILPVLGLWMLPLGLVLLAEDVPLLHRWTGRQLEWIERHRPHWLGLPRR